MDKLMAGYSTPAYHDGRLYVADNSANLHCFQAATGKAIWKKNLGTVGKGSPVWADGKIYLGEVNGKFHILEDAGQECRILHTQEFPDPTGAIVEANGDDRNSDA